jgi:flagella basal body P-ring formation protein FlgA
MKVMAVMLSLMLGAASALGQTMIRMKPSAGVAPGAAVTLGDVATVSGEDAVRLAAVVVVEGGRAEAKTPLNIDRAAVKLALDKAGVNWAKTTLAGGTTAVTFSGAPAAPGGDIVANTPVAPVEVENDRGTLKELIGTQLAAALDVRRDEVRVRFDTLTAADAEWVKQGVQKGWQYEVRAIGTSPTGKTPVRVEAYERDRLALSRTITLEVLVQRRMVVAAAGIAKDQILTLDDLSVQTNWMPATQGGRPPAIEDLIGASAKRRIDAGKPIGAVDVQAPVVVKRGDEVWVHCISGGMVVKTKARSLGAARNGELVNFQVDGSKKIFSARMNGRGRAVMNLDGVADEGASSELSSVSASGSQR